MARKSDAPCGWTPNDPTPAEIEAMKRLIRAEKGESDPVPEKGIVDWTVIQHLLTCDVDESE
jgi:hypothetical protein